MTTPSREDNRRDQSGVWGFAVGIGACAVAIVAIPLTFWFGTVNHWLIFALAFVGGALLGALFAPQALTPPKASRPPADT